MNWIQIKRIVIWRVVFSHSMQQHWIISQSNGDEPQKLGFYPTTGSDQLSGWIKRNPWTCTKKMSWSLFGGLLPVWSTTAFWIQVQALHLRSMLSKSIRCTKTAMPAVSTGQQKGPNYSPWQRQTTDHTTMLQKFYALGYKVLPNLLPYSPTLLPTTSSSFLTTICTKAASTTRMTKKMLSKSSWNPQSGFYTLKE